MQTVLLVSVPPAYSAGMSTYVTSRNAASRPHLLLLGAGHAHIEVLRDAAESPFAADITMVSSAPVQRYSGMLAAVVRSAVPPDAASIDVAALCRRAGATFIQRSALSIEAAAHGVRVELSASGDRQDATVRSASVASVDIGGIGRSVELPGVREFATLLRPASHWETLMTRVAAWAARPSVTLCVVGGGAVGVEMALAVLARCVEGGARVRMELVEAGDAPLSAHGGRASRLAAAALARAGVRVHTSSEVMALTATHVLLSDGRTIAADGVLWATAAAAPPLLRLSALPVSADGFFRVAPTMQSVDGAPVFGAGDCVVHDGAPAYARSGANAVRAGRTLAQNLRAWTAGNRDALQDFVPRVAPLALLDTADGEALLTWRGHALQAGWAQALKRRIDTRYMSTLQHLAS